MPSRIEFSNFVITEMLRRFGGALAPAAHALNISVRTLQRRLARQPELRPDDGAIPLWEAAVNRTVMAGELAEACVFIPDGRTFARYEREVRWCDRDVELEPQVMTDEEYSAFVRDMMKGPAFSVLPKRRSG